MNLKAQEPVRGILLFAFILSVVVIYFSAIADAAIVDSATMQAIYDEVKTPYKQGVVIHPDDVQGRNIDCPTVFRYGSYWYMMHAQIEKDRYGYTTQLARSKNLVEWERLGTILPQGNSGNWDYANAAGGIALADTEWGGTGLPGTYNGKYWLSYFGGAITGYETAPLAISRASTTDPSALTYWTKQGSPMLTINDPDVQSWDNYTLYKSFIMEDPDLTLGQNARFLMYYNARGTGGSSEFIGLATSPDMLNWTRYPYNPVIVNGGSSGTISGDPQIVKIGDVWVMFYFGHGWIEGDTFACSYDLVNWTQWNGPNLIEPSVSYDRTFAHKPWIMKVDGVVYHFYCAVSDNRTIALATSVQDPAPPAPNPLTWQNSPTAIDGNTIIMTAVTATDDSGVEYYFENETITDGSHDSGWQQSPKYVDRNLQLTTTYTYNVKARDLSERFNETDPSASASATTTDTPSDSIAPVPDPMTWSVPPVSDGTIISMTASAASDPAGVEYYFVNETHRSHDSGWQDSPEYIDSGLLADTTYTYKVAARDINSNQNETEFSEPASATTDSVTPNSVYINFQPEESTVPAGYEPDSGYTFADRGNGLSYGWNISHTSNPRERNNANSDQRLDTIMHIHASGAWEIEVDNGEYEVEVTVGDPYYSSSHTINVEGVNYWNASVTGKNEFLTQSQTVQIADGRITIDCGSAAENSTRICYAVITSGTTGDWVCSSPLTMDLNDDCQQNLDDLIIFLNAWIGNGGAACFDMTDFAQMAGQWLMCNRDPSSMCD